MATNETLGLRLTADVTEWDKAFAFATAEAQKLGKEVDETRDAFEEMGKGLTTRMSSVGGLLSKQTHAWGQLEQKVQTVTKATGNYEKSISAINNKVELFNKLLGLGGKAIELAKFSTEFTRLERAIPAEKMAALQRETGGTVSKFELLQRAAKELGTSATAGMTETQLALTQTLTNWQNFFDQAKSALGSFVGSAISWLDRLSDKLADVDTTLRDTARRNVRERKGKGERSIWGTLSGGLTGTLRDLGGDAADEDEVSAELAQLETRQQVQRTRATRRLQNEIAARANTAGFAGNLRRALPFAGRGVSDADLFNKAFGKDVQRGGGGKKQPNPFADDMKDMLGWFDQRDGNAASRMTDSVSAGFKGFWGGPAESTIGDSARGYQPGGDDDFFGIDARGGAHDAALAGAAAKAKELEELQAKFADTSQATGAAYQTVMSGMAAGLSAAVDAAISGGDNIAKAAARASAGALKAVALEAGVKGLFATAEGIFGLNPKGFAAAGVYFATAAAAGVASAALGAAAGPMPSASSAGGPRSAPGGGFASNRSMGGSSGTTENHYHIHGTISAADHRELGATLEKSKNKALNSGKARSEHARTVRME